MLKAKFILNKKCLTDLYFAFIHSYLSYANIRAVATHFEWGGGGDRNTPSLLPFLSPSLPPLPGKRTLVALA